MTTKKGFVDEENKSFDGYYVYCDQYEWNGIPNQKIVLVYHGIRSVDYPGFIHKILAYDYSEVGAKLTHQYRFDPELLERQANPIFQQKVITAH